MQIFFLNGLWRFLKHWHLPVSLHSSVPLPPGLQSLFYQDSTVLLNSAHQIELKLNNVWCTELIKRIKSREIMRSLSHSVQQIKYLRKRIISEWTPLPHSENKNVM